jgi:hypothetical protein
MESTTELMWGENSVSGSRMMESGFVHGTLRVHKQAAVKQGPQERRGALSTHC